jgi:hypothetical protein
LKEVLTWLYRAIIILAAITTAYVVISPDTGSVLSWLLGIIALLAVAFIGLGAEHSVRNL